MDLTADMVSQIAWWEALAHLMVVKQSNCKLRCKNIENRHALSSCSSLIYAENCVW